MAMVDVEIADGRTIFRFRTRGDFIKLIQRKPEKIDEERHVRCWAIRHRDQEGFEPARLSYLRANSVALVRVVEPEERQAFEEQYLEDAVRQEAANGAA
jgi:hypothetical protein